MLHDRFSPAKIAALLLALLPGCGTSESPKTAADRAGLVSLPGGRRMYLTCRGSGSPTVVLVSGQRGSAAEWTTGARPVLEGVAGMTRACAYDRPGTPVGEERSRSEPAPQPTSAHAGMTDLHALLEAAGERGPFVLVGHSAGGMIVRLHAGAHPADVVGMVLVDALGEGLQDAETPEQWAIQRVLLEGDIAESLREYPELERFDPDLSFTQLRASPPPRAMPLVVLSADAPLGPLIEAMAANGTLPPGVPTDFGHVIDAAQRSSQAKQAALVPGARHVTETHSGHNIHHEQPGLVIDTVRDVVIAAREGRARL